MRSVKRKDCWMYMCLEKLKISRPGICWSEFRSVFKEKKWWLYVLYNLIEKTLDPISWQEPLLILCSWRIRFVCHMSHLHWISNLYVKADYIFSLIIPNKIISSDRNVDQFCWRSTEGIKCVVRIIYVIFNNFNSLGIIDFATEYR